MVLLACYSTDVHIDLLSLLAYLLVCIKAGNVSYKLSLDYSNSYLLPDSNADPGGAGLGTRLLYTLH